MRVNMKNKKVYVETLGCSKNRVDSENMLGILEEKEYIITSSPEEANVIIINSCAFIKDAKTESIDMIFEMAALEPEYLILTGCLAQRYATSLVEELDEVQAYVGTTKFPKIDAIIKRLYNGDDNIDEQIPELLPRKITTPPYTAYIKISEGCDNRCTYCIIPRLRGKYRSRELQSIVVEVTRLVSEGVKEVILIAQDSSRYGMDLSSEVRLKDLLIALDKIELIIVDCSVFIMPNKKAGIIASKKPTTPVMIPSTNLAPKRIQNPA